MKTIVLGLGLAGVAALLWSKMGSASTPAPAPAPSPSHPMNDAGTYSPAGASSDVADAAMKTAKAVSLAAIGHGPGKEGETWAAWARASPGVTQVQLAQLKAIGY